MKSNLITLSQLDELLLKLGKENYSVATQEDGSVEVKEFDDVVFTYPSFGEFLGNVETDVKKYEAKVYSFPDEQIVMANNMG